MSGPSAACSRPMPRDGFTDEEMWDLLKYVVAHEDGEPWHALNPSDTLQRFERAGFVWLRLVGQSANFFAVQPTREGAVAAHRWAARQAKAAAREFAR